MDFKLLDDFRNLNNITGQEVIIRNQLSLLVNNSTISRFESRGGLRSLLDRFPLAFSFKFQIGTHPDWDTSNAKAPGIKYP
jgi:hypothetical protein